MALRGTLKDFGIADILQLIGHQSKSGILSVSSRGNRVFIHFHNGSIVRAESDTRQRRDMLGHVLLRAEVIVEQQLEEALQVQRQTSRRLGDILVEMGATDAQTIRDLVRLQTMETLYKLFVWQTGSYEFQQQAVKVHGDDELIRTENVLMEGFRQVDEWPSIRKHITSYAMHLRRIADLDALTAEQSGGEDDLGLDDAFSEAAPASKGSGRLKDIGRNERVVYQLVNEDRDIQKIVDLSRLGEFETCKALSTLIGAQVVAPVARAARASGRATVGGLHAVRQQRWASVVLNLAVVAIVGGAGWYAWAHLDLGGNLALGRHQRHVGHQRQDLQRELSVAQIGRVRHALEVYRAERGDYPQDLEALLREQLLTPRDLTFPWENTYFYARRSATEYVLRRPLY